MYALNAGIGEARKLLIEENSEQEVAEPCEL
jgi:hypothetical protein